ncbi:MAG: hypothetical protein GX971_13325 [Firmicutes bacterium]|nr:hypothetical protein [Bacillota bacterium]
MSKQYLKYGGVRFINHAPPEEINSFVNALSNEDRHSLYNVVSILEREGLISFVEGDTTTIDKDTEEFLVPNDNQDPYF